MVDTLSELMEIVTEIVGFEPIIHLTMDRWGCSAVKIQAYENDLTLDQLAAIAAAVENYTRIKDIGTLDDYDVALEVFRIIDIDAYFIGVSAYADYADIVIKPVL